MSLLLEGDVLRCLDGLIRQHVQVHMAATSTPYFRQRLYDVPDTDWPEIVYRPIFGLNYLVTVPAWRGQLGREECPFDFIGHLIHVFRLVRGVLRDDGTLWVNLGDKYVGEKPGGKSRRNKGSATAEECLPSATIPPVKNLLGIPARFKLAMQADGWWLRNDVVWEKPNASPHPVRDRLTVSHEDIFLFSRRANYYFDEEPIRTPLAESTKARDGYRRAMPQRAEHEAKQLGSVRHDHETISNPGGAQRRTVWRYATRHALEGHYAVWPYDLVEPMIRASTSEYGCCAACGAPYARLVEQEPPPEDIRPTSRRTVPGQPAVVNRQANNRKICDWRAAHPPQTVGWRKPCACDTTDIVRPVVLDPFSGEASTGEEALRLRRDYIGVDADPKNVRTARRRLKPLENLPLLETGTMLARAEQIIPPDQPPEPSAPRRYPDQRNLFENQTP